MHRLTVFGGLFVKTRLITAFIGAVIAIAIMIVGEYFPWVILAALCIVACMMEFEFLTAKNFHKDWVVLVLSLLFVVSSMMVSVTGFWFVPMYAYTVFLLLAQIIRHDKHSVTDIFFVYTGTVFVGMSLLCFARLVCIQWNFTSFFVCVALVPPWFADSAAYFVGSALGKRKLCPSISPKKTVEGAIGGAIGAIVGSQLLGLVYQFIIYRDVIVNYPALLLIGIYSAVFSVVGDLTFSLIKRECKIKDYGSIMPGHGGMLDRFDSVVFTVPFALFVSYTMGLIWQI